MTSSSPCRTELATDHSVSVQKSSQTFTRFDPTMYKPSPFHIAYILEKKLKFIIKKKFQIKNYHISELARPKDCTTHRQLCN